MRQIIILAALFIISCNNNNQPKNISPMNENLVTCNDKDIPVLLSKTLEGRRSELIGYLNTARKNIRNFAQKYGWEELTKEEFMDSIMIFDDKNNFNKILINLAEADTSLKLPDTYCAALEKKTLIVMCPEFYSKVFPEGIEEQSYEKLLTHEIAHRLHVRILNGNEEAMGPIWFYEGFALYAADQFSHSDITIGKTEMIEIMNDPERGNYKKYSYIFRYFANKVPLPELISKANEENFNGWLILKIH